MRPTQNRNIANRPGFTLVEVILALVICLGLVGALLAFYDHAMMVRRAVTEEVELVSAERMIMEHVTAELRGALVYPFLQIGMDGATDRMTFITVTLPGPAAWAVRKSTDEPIPPEHDLELVGYRLRIVENVDGTFTIEGLERTSQKILSAEAPEENREIAVSFLTPHIKFLYLRYWDGSNWLDSWGGGDLPVAVEITLGVPPLPDGVEPVDYPYPTFRRMVYLPGRSSAPPSAGTGGAQTQPAQTTGATP